MTGRAAERFGGGKDGENVTSSDGEVFDEKSETDVADSAIPVTHDAEEDTWTEAARISQRRDWDANEADLIDQAIVAPLPEDEFDVD
ncbi:hypothetical protein KEK_20358 [Mycolicibacterium thermoresistibile ATCC 19527]|uniref:Uncharacterized protein n=2 Tax=Mycolicibacterium thermoresistibile TaxID=1797 RepID=G7CM27_MYCT3|nr:hypothetical protein KEK_20358 [Mycolicibacterium thermoresistibile ATCC 19527]GAT13337.1 putative uncharacterized protein [Mycolicibacterium thermoresistibile]SNW18488.1 Uncharacterised protein [Mycolicibacterium thermoresistibile]